jgi:CspA family cold shock protein
MATGKIKNLVKDRGFGFIQVEGGSDDVFFHSTAVVGSDFDSLSVGQTVEFDIEADPRNPRRSRAGNVRVGA